MHCNGRRQKVDGLAVRQRACAVCQSGTRPAKLPAPVPGCVSSYAAASRQLIQHRYLEFTWNNQTNGQTSPKFDPPCQEEAIHRCHHRPHLQGHHRRREQRRSDGAFLQPVRQGVHPAGLCCDLLPPPQQRRTGWQAQHGPRIRQRRVCP